MATTINKTDGTVLTTIADGAVDLSSTNIALIGRLYRNYGELINENQVKLLENFANSSSPSTPVVGQIWYDTSDEKLKVYRDTGFVPLSVSTSSNVEPSNPNINDQWYDTVDQQLKIYDGSQWDVIAPGYTAAQGKSGVFVETITDTLTTDHIALVFYDGGSVNTVISSDNEYIPNNAISGFTSIKKGINISNASGTKYHGDVTNAELLDNLDSTQFLRSDTNDTATSTITIENAQPLVLGENNELEVNITSANADFVKVNSGAIRFYLDNSTLAMQLNDSGQIIAEQGGANTPSITFNGDTDSGLYWISSNTIGVTVGGTSRLSVSPSGITVVGSVTATGGVSGNVSATSGTVNTLSVPSSLTAPFISGTTTFTGNAIFGADLSVAGDTTLGTSSADDVTIAAGNVTISTGNIAVGGTLVASGISTFGANVNVGGSVTATADLNAGGDVTVGDDIFVVGQLLVQYDSGTTVASLRVDDSGRVLVNTSGPAVAAQNTGDMTLGNTAHVYAANTAKWWSVWKDNTDAGQFEFLGEHHVDSITRESSAGQYKINLDYAMTSGSYWAIVGMGAYGNMNMLEFPVGGSYVRVKNELYDYTGTRDSSYNSVVAFGV